MCEEYGRNLGQPGGDVDEDQEQGLWEQEGKDRCESEGTECRGWWGAVRCRTACMDGKWGDSSHIQGMKL